MFFLLPPLNYAATILPYVDARRRCYAAAFDAFAPLRAILLALAVAFVADAAADYFLLRFSLPHYVFDAARHAELMPLFAVAMPLPLTPLIAHFRCCHYCRHVRFLR